MSTFAFNAINLLIMPLWFGLLFLPRKRWVNRAIDIFVALAAVLFLVNLIPALSQVMPVILKPTLESVGQMLSTPGGALGGWTHFVIGDLWIGRWICRDAQVEHIAHRWVFPLLLLTLLFGPVGLLSYFFVKICFTGRFGTENP